ncbi:MAG TPA: TlpA disulfide reductase family protein [Chitinophagaceae bacterium]
MKFNLFLLLSASLSLSAAACDNHRTGATSSDSSAAVQPAAPTTGNSSLPSFVVVDAEGKQIQLQSLKGKKIFLNIWATWCGPCRREMPSINNLYKSVDTSKVAFVMLSVDDKFEKAKQYVQREKFSLPVYYPGENLPALFNVEGIPATFIFDGNGRLLKQIIGSENYDTDEFRKLLQ